MVKLTEWSIFFNKYAVLILCIVIIYSLPKFCSSHSEDNPSLKYTRESNENFHKNGNGKHDHVGLRDQTHETKHHSHWHYHEFDLLKRNTYQTDMSEIWLHSIGSTLFISAIPFLLLFIIPLNSSEEMRPRLKVLLAFASGGLLGDAFLHLIPHATHPHHIHDESHGILYDHAHDERHPHDHSKETEIGLWVLGGIIAFLTVEKLVRILKGEGNYSHGHSHETKKDITSESKKNVDSSEKLDRKIKKETKIEKVEISGYLNLAADFAHNFTDGLAIGASYLAGNSIGIVTTITILLHEVPHEIGDFAILIKSGCSRRKAMLLQLLTALGALTGNALALIGVGADATTAPWVLPFTAGGFIYIATVNVLPELLEGSTKLGQSIKEICALLTGVILMAFIALLE